MKFEWDANKRQINLQRHGIDFIGVSEVFDDPNALTTWTTVLTMAKPGLLRSVY